MSKLPCDPDLFDLLCCPESHAPLKFVDGRLVSTDRATRRAYRIDGDIPVIVLEESEVLPLPAWEGLMAAEGPVGAGAEAVRRRHAGPAGGHAPAG
jgi:uncharacterized protein YbaR (Trm112 family)